MCVELCEKVQQNDEQLTNQLLPVVKQRLDAATQALSDCLQVKDVAVHWYLSSVLTCSLQSPLSRLPTPCGIL